MKDIRQRSRLRERRRSRRNIFLIGAIVVSFFVLGGMMYGIHHPVLRVDIVVITGEEAVPEQEIKDAVEETLSGSWFFLIPKNSIIFLPKRSLTHALLANIPRLGEVTISRTSFRSIEVRVSERVPVGTWCEQEEEVNTQSFCFLFDSKGFVFARTFTVEGMYMTAPLRDDGEPLQNMLISDGAYPRIEEMVRTVEVLMSGVKSIAFRVPDEVDIILHNDTRVTYLFEKEEDARAYLGSTVLSEAFHPETIAYIDLRFLPKVYVKRKE